MANVFVFVDVTDGAAGDVGLQALALARAVAGGGSVTALAAGSGAAAAAPALFGLGADAVQCADDASLKDYLPGPYLAAVRAALAGQAYGLLLFPANTTGNDLAPLLAAELDAACVLDASAVRAEGGGWTATRVEFDRKVAADYAAAAGKALVVSVKDGCAEVGAPDPARAGAVQPVAFAAPAARSRMARRDVAKKTVNLKAARIIVGAGAGIGSKDNFGRIRELADALGAQIGATRAVVDAGWLPADHQIGQTGATVRPDVYIACGVSGAVQHWVGISEARTIVCINTDKNAPLMKRSHYRIAGDVNAVIPKLVKALNTK